MLRISNDACNFHQILDVVVPLISHVVSIWIYYAPLVKLHPHHELVVDEVHILSSSNKDVTGESSLRDLFLNDYWGRSMAKDDSHKSWRPISILSFRIFNGGIFRSSISPILVARMVNVVLHAALAEMVSMVALALFPEKEKSHQPLYSITLRTLTKLLFSLHPVHVEAVTNAANRPHILALLFTLLALDPYCHILTSAICMALALMSCETAIFQVPAILITMISIYWKRKKTSDLTTTSLVTQLLPRYFVIVLITLCYLIGRVFFGTTDIPDGLIRPAENPFYLLKGYTRVLSYSLVLAIHVAKSFYLDFLGFSHEYGFNCVPQVSSLKDPRLILPLAVVFGIVTISVKVLMRVRRQRKTSKHYRNIDPLLDLLVAYAWMATLFPISGFIKVGTFIADRIVVASTVVVAIFGGRVLTNWALHKSTTPSGESEPKTNPNLIYKLISLLCLFIALSKRCMRRSEHWMSSYELLKSSLETCPKSAKSNLELSKCYSGLFPEKQNYDIAVSYIKEAEKIDPTYCDVHWQMAQIHFKRQEYMLFEERLTKAVLCPFTMSGAASLYKQYWELVAMDSQSSSHTIRKDILQRKAKYDEIIRRAIESEKVVPSNKRFDTTGAQISNTHGVEANKHRDIMEL